MNTLYYAGRDVKRNYFMLPNELFDLKLHYIEVVIYAYLLRIENRKTYECVVSYTTMAEKLGLAVNTVAKYVAKLEEHGLITTEHTSVTRKDGMKRNGCLKYHIMPIRHAIDLFHERQLSGVKLAAERQRAYDKAEKNGVEFYPAEEGGEKRGA